MTLAASAQRFQVKLFYIAGTRVKGLHLQEKKTDGSTAEIKDEDVPTQELIQLLVTNEKLTRSVAAYILRNRKEKGVPEALLKTAKFDQNLDVMKEALQSFDLITGYNNVDIFGYEYALKWWMENKVTVDPKLKDMSTTTASGDDKKQ